MTDREFLKAAIKIHTMTVNALINSIDEYTTHEQIDARLSLIRKATNDFEGEVLLPILERLKS